MLYTHIIKLLRKGLFFFEVEGKEVKARYMIGFIYADWLDEFDQDLISTDRSSLNWNAEELKSLAEWGKGALPKWLKKYDEYRDECLNKKIGEIVTGDETIKQISGVETEALKSLLKEAFPLMRNADDEKLRKTCTVMMNAWVRMPMRQEVKALWGNLKATPLTSDGFDSFLNVIDGLRQHLVPEMLDAAVTVAQRLFAIRQMNSIITNGLTETHLQRLIEDFPWILCPEWETFMANSTLRKIALKIKGDDEKLDAKDSKLRPDFVFLSDSASNNIIVIELKGAEHHKTADMKEYRQLSDYLNDIAVVHPHARLEGRLITHAAVTFPESLAFDKRIKMLCWSDVLKNAAKIHEELLKSLIFASKVSYQQDC